MSRAGDKSSRHIGAFVLFLVGVALTLGLYGIKINAQSARADLRSLTKAVEAEQTDIELLLAEIALLQNPERLGEMAKAELGLTSITVEQTLSKKQIVKTFPLRETKVAVVESEAP